MPHDLQYRIRLSAVPAEQDRIDLRLIQQQVLFGRDARFDPVIEQNHAVFQRIANAQVALTIPKQQIVRRETADVNDKRSWAVLQRLEYRNGCGIRLRIATHLVDQNLVLPVMQREADRPPVQKIFCKPFLLRTVMRRRQADRKLHPHRARSVERCGFQFIRDCKERQYEEAFVLRFVPAVWNPLVCERIIPPLIGQRFTSKWLYLAAYQPGCERRMVDRFYLFVPMIDRN